MIDLMKGQSNPSKGHPKLQKNSETLVKYKKEQMAFELRGQNIT